MKKLTLRTYDEEFAKLPKERQEKIKRGAEEMMIDLQLYKIREELQLTQQQMADAMGIAQPAVVALEKRGKDIKLSSMKRYIEAMGGELSLSVKLSSGKTISFQI
ncbi:MAG: XRE family transcriptional regulator [Neisseriaceae bacterium]|nr:XRE family transcriptional regulator [Neisseriaceae bacterium]MBR7002566.1 XRE family transcriptional regulator [Neisseriaceae bacterium]